MELYYNTVTPLLKCVLEDLMSQELFAPFRLVGGTSLSLQIGHRMSVDIDLFTDAKQGSIDFKAINEYLQMQYNYVKLPNTNLIGFGCSYFVGNSEDEVIKLDLYYTNEPYLGPAVEHEGVRLASIQEIMAMKFDVVGRGGRKKDFWDIHAFIDQYTFEDLVNNYQRMYPYGHSKDELREGFKNFSKADEDFEPVCLFGKIWELIKLDLIEWASV